MPDNSDVTGNRSRPEGFIRWLRAIDAVVDVDQTSLLEARTRRLEDHVFKTGGRVTVGDTSTYMQGKSPS